MNTVSNQSQGSVWGSQPILSLCRSLKQDMWFMLFIQTSLVSFIQTEMLLNIPNPQFQTIYSFLYYHQMLR